MRRRAAGESSSPAAQVGRTDRQSQVSEPGSGRTSDDLQHDAILEEGQAAGVSHRVEVAAGIFAEAEQSQGEMVAGNDPQFLDLLAAAARISTRDSG